MYPLLVLGFSVVVLGEETSSNVGLVYISFHHHKAEGERRREKGHHPLEMGLGGERGGGGYCILDRGTAVVPGTYVRSAEE